MRNRLGHVNPAEAHLWNGTGFLPLGMTSHNPEAVLMRRTTLQGGRVHGVSADSTRVVLSGQHSVDTGRNSVVVLIYYYYKGNSISSNPLGFPLDERRYDS